MPNITMNPLTVSDAEKVYTEIARSRDHLVNLEWSEVATLDTVRQFIIDKTQPTSTSVLIGLFYNKEFAGCLEIRNKGNYYEPGYWLGFEFRGKGVLQKALSTVFPLLDMPIIAHVRKINVKSAALLIQYGGMHVTEQEGEWVYLKRECTRR